MKRNVLLLLLAMSGPIAVCQPENVNNTNIKTIHISVLQPSAVVHPLDKMVIVCQPAGRVSIIDSKGTEYLNMQVNDRQEFLAGGAAGIQTARLFDMKGNLLGSSSFRLEASDEHNRRRENFGAVQSPLQWDVGILTCRL